MLRYAKMTQVVVEFPRHSHRINGHLKDVLILLKFYYDIPLEQLREADT